MGPTASGKTALACELVQRFPFEIISVDSAMIYKGMNIGTAKPNEDELARAPHHLIDILDPPSSYSAAEFCKDVETLTQAITSRGKIPLLVGGTMMYFNALQQGLSILPEANAAIRAELLVQVQQHGWAYMHQQLMNIDECSALRIHPHDTQRIQRALEVYYLTGQSLSSFLSAQKNKLPYQFANLILFPEHREWLHARIATRFNQMLEAGFVAEVDGLCRQWPFVSSCPAMRSVGYRQVLGYLRGDYDYPTLCQKGIEATRQLAKRQLTWLRSWQDARFFDSERSETMSKMMAIIDEILDNS